MESLEKYLEDGKLSLGMLVVRASVSVQTVGGLEVRSVPLSDMLESSSSALTSESSTSNGSGVRSLASTGSGEELATGSRASRAASQTCFISLKVESLERSEQKTCLSSTVATATAFGIILAVFSLLIFNTDTVGINNFVT